ncbi:MAG TPA: branched-chain amino acid ABC transporter permease [Kiloniellales bacterium]|nr:branched-chain amino acid ABC transporter permease [Kiloniellales bacterium]
MLPRTRLGRSLLLLGVGLLVAFPWFVPNFYVTLGAKALIWAMLALSLQLLAGGVGLVSLGHAAFFGLAAYSVSLLTPEGESLSVLVTLPIAIVVASLAALLIGALSLRTRGFFFLMVTLAFGQMMFFLFHDTTCCGGADGVSVGRPALGAFGIEWTLGRGNRSLVYYYLNLALIVALYLGLAFLLRSLFGRVLQGIRVNEHRMQALGFDVYRYKLAAFTLSGAIAGLAGHMWVMSDGRVNPELASWHTSAEALLMVLLGGLHALHGAVIGALALTGLNEVSQLITERQLLVQGLVILLIVLLLPRGLAGLGLRRRREVADDD